MQFDAGWRISGLIYFVIWNFRSTCMLELNWWFFSKPQIRALLAAGDLSAIWDGRVILQESSSCLHHQRGVDKSAVAFSCVLYHTELNGVDRRGFPTSPPGLPVVKWMLDEVQSIFQGKVFGHSWASAVLQPQPEWWQKTQMETTEAEGRPTQIITLYFRVPRLHIKAVQFCYHF